jgi:preprotein translocase subunit YajC
MIITNILLMTGGQGGNPLTSFLPFLLIIVVFYFFMIRPQSKKAKDQQQFKDTLAKGDKVVTIGGIHATLIEVKPTTFIIETGSGRLEIEKSAVSLELTKGVNKGAAKEK